MYPIFLAFLLLPNSIFCNELRHHVQETREKVTSEDLTSEILGALRSFNQKTVQYPFLASTIQNAAFADPLTLATFWAVVNERVFDVETGDLVKSVGLPADRIAPVYATLNNYLNQDTDFLSTSAIFSELQNATSFEGIQKLKTYFETVDFHNNATIEKINAYIDDHTQGVLRDQLLPAENPFYNSTRGLILNTVSYRRLFAKPLGQGQKLSFQVTPDERISVNTVEISSTLKVSQDERTNIVVIPLKSEAKKSIILVHPKNMTSFLQKDFEHFVKRVDTISRYDSTKLPYFQTRPVRVQLPSFNFTLARTLQELEQPVKIVSTSSAVCDTATAHANFLQHPVQVSRVSLTAAELSMTAIIGAQVDNVEEYRKGFGAGSHSPTPEVSITERSSEPKQQKAQLRSDFGEETQIYVHVQHEARSGKFGRSTEEEEVRENIIVNSPFLLALHDYDVGMHSFLVVSRPQSEVEASKDMFSEYAKLQRWLCIPSPAPRDGTN